MRETGEVIAAAGANVTVRMRRTSACAHCKACEVGSNGSEMRVTARNDCNARVSDFVRVELKPEAFLSAALILYGLPFTGLTAGFAAGYYAGELLRMGTYSSLLGFISGLVLAALVYAGIRKMEPRWRAKGYVPAATAVLEEPEQAQI